MQFFGNRCLSHGMERDMIFFLWLFSFMPEKPQVDPKKILLLGWDELGWLGLHGIFSTLNITVTNPENLKATSFCGAPKDVVSKLSVDPFWMIKLFFLDKNPGRLHVTFGQVFSTTKSQFSHHTDNRKYGKRGFFGHVQGVSIPD